MSSPTESQLLALAWLVQQTEGVTGGKYGPSVRAVLAHGFYRSTLDALIGQGLAKLTRSRASIKPTPLGVYVHRGAMWSREHGRPRP